VKIKLKKGAVPGLAIAVVFQDKVVYAADFGLRDVNTQEPVNADTVFQLASLSKPVGSTVVAELVGEGKISWDSRISDLDTEFAMYDPWITREITTRDFYAHRSGLPDHTGDLLEDLGFTRGEILHRLRYQKPDSSFRLHYAYTNFGITEAAVAAAKAYNIAWEDASEQKLYRPLERCFPIRRRSACSWERTTPNRPRHPPPRWRLAHTSGLTPTTFLERFRLSKRETDSRLSRAPQVDIPIEAL
jgi:CubicO group peptidase (beta-lactamase class C family)